MTYLKLGPFDLVEKLASGGMGEVWRGVHRAQQLPVAVKIITAHRARDADYVEAFEREVESVASLMHPGIVTVFDYGEISAEQAAESDARFVEGSPYLVMEFVDGRPLDQIEGKLDWPLMRLILLQILDGLAHSHARELVHRDLKPGNVLVSDDPESAWLITLTDFGLAHLRFQDAPPEDESTAVGTPQYMAPEQFRGNWRDFGPWTDLYSLGCIAFEMACGYPPFPSDSYFAVARAKTSESPRDFNPDFRVPPRLEDWIFRMLEKNPLRRFHRAADAALILSKMSFDIASADDSIATLIAAPSEAADDELPEAVEIAGGSQTARASTERWRDLARRHSDRYPTLSLLYEAATGLSDIPESEYGDANPLQPSPVAALTSLSASRDWRSVVKTRASLPLIGAGLGLYGLRSIPLVDREPERDLIWSELESAVHHGDTRVVVLSGETGVGKSRLAEWLYVRTHELGRSICLRSGHSPGGGPQDGVSGFARAFLHCNGLNRPAMKERCEWLMDSFQPGRDNEWGAEALTEIMEPDDDGGVEPYIEFGDDAERYRLMQVLMAQLATERPITLWFDDAQWGADSLDFARHLATGDGPDLACLVIVTVDEERLVERPAEQARLDALCEHPKSRRLRLGPLPQTARVELVEELLHMEPSLARRVVEFSGGKPARAVRLVEELVEHGLLEPTERGFRLVDEVELEQFYREI
jgi:serine/threonine protein kinase